jgi:hypothetical protein
MDGEVMRALADAITLILVAAMTYMVLSMLVEW